MIIIKYQVLEIKFVKLNMIKKIHEVEKSPIKVERNTYQRIHSTVTIISKIAKLLYITQTQINQFQITIFQMNKSSTLKDFEVVSRLGQGSFSSVYKVKRNDDNTFYALKKVKIGQMCEKEKENALNQVRILASISHPNVINYREAFFDDPSQTLCIVMEIAQAGDILKKIENHIKQKTYYKEAQIWKAFIHMTKGLKSLHDMNILHRDLKCANVFCTADGIYKLGDLNVSKVAKKGMARTQTGTPYYTSPEVWKQRPYDYKCDIWSLGCVVYEMAALKPPFRASNLKQLYNKIQKGIFERIPNFYSDDLNNMINLCMKVNPNLRPSTSQILNNPEFIRNILPGEISKPMTKQSNSLLKTIIVPKNLKSLREALPASKYQQNQSSVQILPKRVYQRINSAHSLGKQIQESKLIDLKTPNLRYNNRREDSQLLKRNISNRIQVKYQQEKSYQYIKPSSSRENIARQHSRQIIREKSKEILKEISNQSKEARQIKERLHSLLADRNKQNKRVQQVVQISPKVKNALEVIKKAEKNYKEIISQRRKDKEEFKPRSQSFDKENKNLNDIQTKRRYYLPAQRKHLPPRRQRY